MRPARIVALATLVHLVACSGDAADSTVNDAAGSSSAGTVDAPAALTFHGQVSRIFQERCVSCHIPGGVAPFALDDYREAKVWASAIASSVAARTMPPSGMNEDGSCGTFADSMWLSDGEIQTIEAWVAAGSPEGDPAAAPEPAEPVLSLTEGRDFTLPAPYEPVGGFGGPNEDYRCFAVTAPMAESSWITAFEVLPDNTSLVHHALVFAVGAESLGQLPDGGFGTNAQVMGALDDQSPSRPGWPCVAAGEGINPRALIGAWAPGAGPMYMPNGTGIALREGDVLVMQVHYSLGSATGEGERTDRTRLRLQEVPEVDRRLHVALPDPFLWSAVLGSPDGLAPGHEAIEYTWELPLSEAYNSIGESLDVPERMNLVGITPHMHRRGRKMRVELISEDGDEASCVADVHRWDFDWQFAYWYAAPIAVTKDTRVRVTCTYDTSADSVAVMPGQGTNEEMCMTALYLVDMD